MTEWILYITKKTDIIFAIKSMIRLKNSKKIVICDIIVENQNIGGQTNGIYKKRKYKVTDESRSYFKTVVKSR